MFRRPAGSWCRSREGLGRSYCYLVEAGWLGGLFFRLTEEFAELETGLVKLGFAVAGGALEHRGDLVVLEAFDVVEDEDHAIAGGERGDGALEGYAVDLAGELESAAAEVALGRIFFRWVDGLFERDAVEAFFTEMHQD